MVASHDQSMHQHSEWFFRQPPGERASRASDGCAHIAPMPAPDGPVRASAFVSLQGQGEHWSAPRFAGIRGRVGLRRWRPSRVRLRVPRRRASERCCSRVACRAPDGRGRPPRSCRPARTVTLAANREGGPDCRLAIGRTTACRLAAPIRRRPSLSASLVGEGVSQSLRRLRLGHHEEWVEGGIRVAQPRIVAKEVTACVRCRRVIERNRI